MTATIGAEPCQVKLGTNQAKKKKSIYKLNPQINNLKSHALTVYMLYLVLPLHHNPHGIFVGSRQVRVFLKKPLYLRGLRVNLLAGLWNYRHHKCYILVCEGKKRKDTSIRSFCRLLSSLSTMTAISCNCFSSFSLSCCQDTRAVKKKTWIVVCSLRNTKEWLATNW